MEKPGLQTWTPEDFQVSCLVGNGALARVYLGFNRRTKERVALKVIQKKKVIGNPQLRQGIWNERNILISLGCHPNVVSLIAAFQDASRIYFVLDYVGRINLKEIIVENTHLLNKHVVSSWIGDIVKILSYLRRKGVVHNDIKVAVNV